MECRNCACFNTADATFCRRCGKRASSLTQFLSKSLGRKSSPIGQKSSASLGQKPTASLGRKSSPFGRKSSPSFGRKSSPSFGRKSSPFGRKSSASSQSYSSSTSTSTRDPPPSDAPTSAIHRSMPTEHVLSRQWADHTERQYSDDDSSTGLPSVFSLSNVSIPHLSEDFSVISDCTDFTQISIPESYTPETTTSETMDMSFENEDDYVSLALPRTPTRKVDRPRAMTFPSVDTDDRREKNMSIAHVNVNQYAGAVVDEAAGAEFDFISTGDDEKDKIGHKLVYLFAGRKPHRKSSLRMEYKQYYLNWPDRHRMTSQVVWRGGDTRLLFADYVQKINPRMKRQERVMILSDLAIYFLPDISYSVNRRIKFEELVRVSLSSRGDHWIVLHCNVEKLAVVIMCKHRTEFLLALQKEYFAATERNLEIQIKDHIVYSLKGNQNFSILFCGDGATKDDEFDYTQNPDNKDEIFVKYQFPKKHLASDENLKKVTDPGYVEKLRTKANKKKGRKKRRKNLKNGNPKHKHRITALESKLEELAKVMEKEKMSHARELLESEPLSDWNVGEVCLWIKSFGSKFEKYVDDFIDNGVDGEYLHMLTKDDFKELIPKSMHRKRVWNALQNLKTKDVSMKPSQDDISVRSRSSSRPQTSARERYYATVRSRSMQPRQATYADNSRW